MIQSQDEQSIRLTWPYTSPGFVLDEAGLIGGTVPWLPVRAVPLLQGNQFTVSLPVSATARFFRLRLPGLTIINQTSPLDGETGVAVTRETIIRLSAPLAANTILKTNHFYATFGGRRLLSRAELSSDRTKATLFYLEPLPGSARVTVVFDGAGLTDEIGRPVDADGDGNPGGSTVISYDTLNLTALPGTAVKGTVYASGLTQGGDTGSNVVNKPLAGVTITVDGMEQSLRTVTDANGNFTLSPAPPGRFFVHIDGRTVTDPASGIHYPDKAYYPFVGKAWDAVAGRMDNPAGGTGKIYLPLIAPGTLQPVSATIDTTISFPPSIVSSNPALAGVSITVRANSLFADDGTHGGMVGIAPVPPDRLPGPLPPGLEFPIVITVQSDGPLNFDKPAAICFPNLSDPVLKTPLPSGSKQSLISFNHKKGMWEAVGSMTVSEDGKFICTDPGVGILQPGWHGVGPQPEAPPPPSCGGGGEGTAFLSKQVRLSGLHTGDVALFKTPAECKQGCQEASVQCETFAYAGFGIRYRACQKTFQGNCPHLKGITGALESDLEVCKLLKDQCESACDEPPKPPPKPPKPPKKCRAPRPKSSFLSLSSVSQHSVPVEMAAAVKQVHAVIDEILALTRKYSASDTPCPADVEGQVASLWERANQLAGGDASALLSTHALELELAETSAPDHEEPFGNAPERPVNFVAVIQRPAGELVVRGLTEDYGQYQLFIPRDAVGTSIHFYDPVSRSYGFVHNYLRPDANWRFPSFTLYPLNQREPDSDGDGLPDIAEFVVGTNPNKKDTDGDGISDGIELGDGTNPLDGEYTQAGIIATAKTPGPAEDVVAWNDLVVTAEGAAGISIFNAYAGLNPTIIARVPTPGKAQRIAFDGGFVAVAQPDAGLSVIDVSTPSAARIAQQIRLGGAQAVTAGSGLAYVGTDSGLIFTVDLRAGTVMSHISVTNAVWDLAVSGDLLYAITDDRLLVFSLANGSPTLESSTLSPFFAAPNRRLFVGGGIAYAVHAKGYNTFDLSKPRQPTLIKPTNTGQFGWKQIVPNGAGLGLAVVGPNLSDDGGRDISLYDLGSPTNTDVFVTTFPMPGIARAVTLDNGLTYVAADSAGLQVLNYLARDNKNVPPLITLIPGFDASGAQAGAHVYAIANATDDVQVRNVEFYLDGVRVFSDGSFPFEYRFVAPAFTATRTNFTLRARAIDTGGNATSSEAITVSLLPDAKPPAVIATTPFDSGGARNLTTVLASFSEPMNPATLTPASFELFAAGPDGTTGTLDDVLVSGGVVRYRDAERTAALTFATSLPNGGYRAVLSKQITDLAGNQMAADYAWDFQLADATFWVNLGNGAWDDAANWEGGVVPSPADDVIINLPVTVSLKSGMILGRTVRGVRGSKLYLSPGTGLVTNTFDDATLDIDLLIGRDVKVRVINGLTLNGVLTLDGGLNFTQLNFDGTQTFDGTGEVVLTGPNSITTQVQPVNGTLTIGPKLIIRGSGAVGRPELPLINQGTILAEGELTMKVLGSDVTNLGTLNSNGGTIMTQNIENKGTLSSSARGAMVLVSNWNNAGVITVTNGSLTLGGNLTHSMFGTINSSNATVYIAGTLDNRDSTLILDASKAGWQLNTGTIIGGTINSADGVALTVTAYGTPTLDGVVLNADLVIGDNADPRVINGLTFHGTCTLYGGINTTSLNFDGTQTLDGQCQINLAGPYGGPVIRPINGTLTIGAGVTIRGGFGNLGNANLPLVNLGTITADGAGSKITVRANPFTNSGTTRELNGGTIQINP